MPGVSGPVPRAAQVTLVITRRCQMSCPDCPLAGGTADMDPGTLQKAISVFAGGRGDSVAVKFFGGEPLLRFDLVKAGILRLCGNGRAGPIEVGTNGLLLDTAKIGYFASRPGVQLNVNALVSVSRGFSALPNLVWNLLISPDRPLSALRILERILRVSASAPPRVNILPAYYREWNPSALRLLGKTLRRVRAFKDSGRIRLENESRWGPLPLFNGGITVDTDGRYYHGNLVLAARSRSAAAPMLAGDLCLPGARNPSVRVPDNISAAKKIFGIKAVAGGFAADRLAEKILFQ